MKTVERKKRKRKYSKDPLKKVQRGEQWTLPLKVDNDLALLIIKEQRANPNGGNFNRVINNRLRRGYGLK